MVRPCFFFSEPEIAPRTLCGCQSNVVAIWAMVAALREGRLDDARISAATALRPLDQRDEAVIQSGKIRPLLDLQAELASMRSRANAALATISGALPRTLEALLRYLPGEEGLARAS